MPVYAEDLNKSAAAAAAATRLSLVQQVVDCVCNPSKLPTSFSKLQQPQSPKAKTSSCLDMEMLSIAAAAAAAAAATTTTAPAASLHSQIQTKCPYATVATRPAVPYIFQMPLHYPRYTRAEYETMPEWKLDRLLEEYGVAASLMGSLQDKRDYAIGAFQQPLPCTLALGMNDFRGD